MSSMRILFCPFPGLGHTYPLLPLARAFRERGDDVAFAGPPTLVSFLAVEDFELLTAGAEWTDIVAEQVRRTQMDRYGEISTDQQAEAFGGVHVDLSTEGILAAARQWRPDLIISDYYDMSGGLVAAVLDVPSATVTLGQDPGAEYAAVVRDKIAPRYQAYKASPRDHIVVADICPPALQVDGWQKPDGWLPLRPETHRAPGGAIALPGKRSAGRPRVLLTFGTVFSDPEHLAPVITKLETLDIDLRVTLGTAATPEDFDVDRARVTFEPFQPMAELVTGVDLVVSHGGAGTTLGTLALGIPMVFLPLGADHFVVSEQAVAAGTGLRLLPADAGPGSILRAVNTVLAEPRFRDSAAKIAEEIAGMPSPSAVAEEIALRLS